MIIQKTVNYKVVDGKLVPLSAADEFNDQEYKKTLKEGDIIQVTFEPKSKHANYALLSKLHASIRNLAVFSGTSFSDMKEEVKKLAGLYVNGEYKSFSECSNDELALAIAETYKIAEILEYTLP